MARPLRYNQPKEEKAKNGKKEINIHVRPSVFSNYIRSLVAPAYTFIPGGCTIPRQWAIAFNTFFLHKEF